MAVSNWFDDAVQWICTTAVSQGKRQAVTFDATLLCLKRIQPIFRKEEGRLQARFTDGIAFDRTVVGVPEGDLFPTENLDNLRRFLQSTSSFRIILTITARVGRRIFKTKTWLIGARGPSPLEPPLWLAGKVVTLV